MKTNKIISLKSFNKHYSKKPIFQSLDLDINKGEFICILGPNGCGKSTLLHSVANLINHQGEIKKKSLNVDLLSQNPHEMILPWLNVQQNIIFPSSKNGIDYKLLESLLNMTKLSNYRRYFPKQLSGGMIQLVLISRALLNNSDILLLDEPFQYLDLNMTKKMQDCVLNLWSEFNPTIIMVSHDVDEAIYMADRIIVLSDKPTTIKNIVHVNMPRPRNVSMLSSRKFSTIKEDVLNAFFN